MSTEQSKTKIQWYRSPVPHEDLISLYKRSNWQGWFQSAGHLGVLVLTGSAAWYAIGRLPLLAVLALLFLHGTFYAFLVNGFHELCHKTVFENRSLNIWFRNIYSFLGWYNHVFFWESHQKHHKFTLHPPDDLEVVLPGDHSLKSYLTFALVNPIGLYNRLKSVIRMSLGKVDGEWGNALFPPEATDLRRKLVRWARLLLIGHGLIVVVSLYFGLWMIPILVTLAPFYGGALQFLCNDAQHTGLADHVSDYRLNTRTILLNPFLRFLYWHMNYHIEHHMFTAVPCYNLGKLHTLIKDDLPHCPNGLIATWIEIVSILRQQQANPDYQFVPDLPQADRV